MFTNYLFYFNHFLKTIKKMDLMDKCNINLEILLFKKYLAF
jgi:hypothetical protein